MELYFIRTEIFIDFMDLFSEIHRIHNFYRFHFQNHLDTRTLGLPHLNSWNLHSKFLNQNTQQIVSISNSANFSYMAVLNAQIANQISIHYIFTCSSVAEV